MLCIVLLLIYYLYSLCIIFLHAYIITSLFPEYTFPGIGTLSLIHCCILNLQEIKIFLEETVGIV